MKKRKPPDVRTMVVTSKPIDDTIRHRKRPLTATEINADMAEFRAKVESHVNKILLKHYLSNDGVKQAGDKT